MYIRIVYGKIKTWNKQSGLFVEDAVEQFAYVSYIVNKRYHESLSKPFHKSDPPPGSWWVLLKGLVEKNMKAHYSICQQKGMFYWGVWADTCSQGSLPSTSLLRHPSRRTITCVPRVAFTTLQWVGRIHVQSIACCPSILTDWLTLPPWEL